MSTALLRRLIPALLLLGLFLPAPLPGTAQVRAGATLTVLRGTVGVVQANGDLVSPAAGGMSLGVGDRVATVAASGALVTFFDGSEVELGSDTSIVIRNASGEGARSNITIESVVGSTVHRVVTITDPGSSYRVESSGTVALVRGTLFAHRVEPTGDITVALAGCGQVIPGRSSETCLDFPRPGMPMRPGDVRTATARGDIITDSFPVEAPLFSVVANPVEPGDTATGTDNPGIRTGSRDAPQGQAQQPGDDKDQPPASLTPVPTATLAPSPQQQVAAAPTPGQAVLTANAPVGSTALQVSNQVGFLIGDIVVIGAPGNQEQGQIAGFGSIILLQPTGRNHVVGEPVVRTGSAATPTSTPGAAPVPCNAVTNSGGAGVITTAHELGRTSGTFNFFYNAFSIPDRFEIIYEGHTLVDTGSVSGSATVPVNYAGTSTTITVRVTGPSGTAWTYTVNCPT